MLALEAEGLGKRYGRRWALRNCTIQVPAGRVVGLVGPNGAGKTTLLQLAVGLLRPSEGGITVLGGRPGHDAAQLARVGFLAQETPVYASLTVEDHLRLGARLNPGWDSGMARQRIEELRLDPGQRAGHLSGGERAQLALTLALAKRPELLVLDEPVAGLDPLARREFLQALMEAVAEQRLSVILSSHLVGDLERVCDYLIVLVASELRLAGAVDELLASHHRLIGSRRDPSTLPANQQVIEASHTDRQSTLLVRTDAPIHDPSWTVERVSLEDMVLAYMGQSAARSDQPPLRGYPAMTWLTWRQFRMQSFVAVAGLLAMALFVGITGPHLAHLYDASGIAACVATGGNWRITGGDCGSLMDQFLANDSRVRPVLDLLLLAIPAVVGMFWGAPLVARELETGTYRLAWTQSVTRSRWLASKLALIGLASIAVVGLIALALTWWYNPVDHVTGNRFLPGTFDERGIVPMGYAAFAFALGVASGMVIRRTLPAMAVTLGVFIVTRLAFTTWLRPLLISPAHLALALKSAFGAGIMASPVGETLTAGPPTIANAWVYSSQIVDQAGNAPSTEALHQFIQSACPEMAAQLPTPNLDIGSGHAVAAPVHGAGPAGADACWSLASTKFHELVTYQPASRFWAFQGIETATFVAFALVLVGFCFWWLRHRLS